MTDLTCYTEFMNKLFGSVISLLSAVGYALLLPLFKKGSTGIPPFTAMAISMFVLFSISLIFSIVFEHGLQLKMSALRTPITFLLLAGAINVVAFWLELIGLKHLPVWQFALFTILSPVLSSIFAYFILGEPLTGKLFLGLGIMGVGLYVAMR